MEWSEPLSGFSRLIGGRWEFEGGYHVFEWSVEKRLVKSSSYFIEDGRPTLVSEGFWFWHPGEKKLKGYAVAVKMPVVFFDYTTKFENERIISELRSYSGDGKEEEYIETFQFLDEDSYLWTLSTKEANREVMRDRFKRKRIAHTP